MKSFKRDMFLIPRPVADKIYHRFGYAALGEFTRLVDMYQRHWDAHGTGEEFDLSVYSDTSLIYFDLVQDKIDEKNREYFSRCGVLAQNAAKATEARTRAKKRREERRRNYALKKDAYNEVRRKRYAEQNGKTAVIEGAEKRDPTADGNFGEVQSRQKTELSGVQSRQKTELSVHKSVHKSVDKRNLRARKEANEKVLSLVDEMVDESTLALGGQGLARKQPNRRQDYGYYGHNNHKYKKRNFVFGEAVDKSKHNPIGSLSGHNRADGHGHKPLAHKLACRQGGVIGHKDIGLRTKPQGHKPLAHNPPQPPGRQLPAWGEQRLGKGFECARPSRPTQWLDDAVIVGDDFAIDLTDKYFQKFCRADKFLKSGFENWCKKYLRGEKHDKIWLAKLFERFAVRQNKISKLLE